MNNDELFMSATQYAQILMSDSQKIVFNNSLSSLINELNLNYETSYAQMCEFLSAFFSNALTDNLDASWNNITSNNPWFDKQREELLSNVRKYADANQLNGSKLIERLEFYAKKIVSS